MFHDVVGINGIGTFIWERQSIAQVSPDVAFSREGVSVDVNPAFQIVFSTRPKMDPDLSILCSPGHGVPVMTRTVKLHSGACHDIKRMLRLP